MQLPRIVGSKRTASIMHVLEISFDKALHRRRNDVVSFTKGKFTSMCLDERDTTLLRRVTTVLLLEDDYPGISRVHLPTKSSIHIEFERGFGSDSIDRVETKILEICNSFSVQGEPALSAA